MKLTVSLIRKIIKQDPRLNQTLDLGEKGKAIIYTADGWTWDPQDGDRTVEGFLISENNCDNDPQDTLAYFEGRLAAIEPVGGY
jgi:hypothetical protein